MKIAFSNDHAAFPMRNFLVDYLRAKGIEVLDLGTHSLDSVDYPDQGAKAAEAVIRGEADRAIVVCGSGLGISISANKVPGIRCALCTDVYAAEMSRKHNDANALALRAREMDVETNYRIIDAWLATDFEGGRHQTRVDKISAIEKKYSC